MLSAGQFAAGAEYNSATGAFENHTLGNTYNDFGGVSVDGTTAPANFGFSIFVSGFQQVGEINSLYIQSEDSDLFAKYDDTLNVLPPPGISAVPEPSTWAMMLLGFCGLGILGYRKSSKAAAASMLAA